MKTLIAPSFILPYIIKINFESRNKQFDISVCNTDLLSDVKLKVWDKLKEFNMKLYSENTNFKLRIDDIDYLPHSAILSDLNLGFNSELFLVGQVVLESEVVKYCYSVFS